jgi:hypothetical protein
MPKSAQLVGTVVYDGMHNEARMNLVLVLTNDQARRGVDQLQGCGGHATRRDRAGHNDRRRVHRDKRDGAIHRRTPRTRLPLVQLSFSWEIHKPLLPASGEVHVTFPYCSPRWMGLRRRRTAV